MHAPHFTEHSVNTKLVLFLLHLEGKNLCLLSKFIRHKIWFIYEKGTNKLKIQLESILYYPFGWNP